MMKNTDVYNLRIALLSFCFLWLSSSVFGQEKFSYDAHEKRDPLWSLVTPQGSIVNYDNNYEVGDLNLQGIIVGQDGNNVALINGAVLSVGEKIGQYTLLRVDSDAVTLQHGVEEFILRLKKKEE